MTSSASSLTDCRGLPVSNADAGLVELLDLCIEEFLAFDGDPVARLSAALEDNPNFVMGHCFKAAMLTQAMETRIYDDMVASLAACEALWDRANDRERGHMKAVRAWVDGDFNGAVQCWEAVLVDYPFDIVALALVHLSDVLLGDVVGQRDSVARVFPLWDESIPGYEFVLGFYSFGLEENRDFGIAEEYGRRALSLRPNHPYAVHAVAHVMEMKGRQSGGVAFMRRHAGDWAKSNFRNHLWWHLSLFHLDLCQYDQVFEIYDSNLRSQTPGGDKYEELDASALLWRLKLCDVEPNGRWEALAEKWAHSVQDTLYAFNDVHAMMTFVSAGRQDLAEELLSANERYVEHANDANVAMSRIIGLPFCRAIRAFAAGEYQACVDELLPVRYRTHRLGGSFAQRDIIGWTLLEAALRAGQGNLALALANERCQLKPSSPQNWRLVARAHTAAGDMERARRAMARAESLMVVGG
jgi:tetratricopeptide (TPR) repeat protein